MNIGWNIETYLSIAATILSIIGSILILKINWKRYGLLFLLSAVVGITICYIFVGLGFYQFPYRLFPRFFKIPFTVILTIFPFYVLFGVRYSPRSWPWKIPFYWVIVHLGMSAETWVHQKTQLIKYSQVWDVWDSYTWWWIFLLIFEWVGGMIVPQESRKPLDAEILRFGRIGWFILHFILITTIFLAGYLIGRNQ
ncbi:MAG: hypothetical protein N2484_07450 [Clostridia bacterium]|nr:hypothetical protein [Clostridia bacterium]